MVYAKKVTEAFLKHAEHAIFTAFIVYVSPEVLSSQLFFQDSSEETCYSTGHGM